MKNNKLMRMLVVSIFAAMLVALPLAAVNADQEKTGCEKKAKAEACEKAKSEGCEKKEKAEACDKMKGEGCMMLKAIPDLSEEQKGKLETLHAAHKAEMAAAMAEMQKKCQAHHEAVKAMLTDAQKAKLPAMTGCMMMHGMHMEGKGCQEKHAKHECQKKAAEEKK